MKSTELNSSFNVLITSISRKIPMLKAVRRACMKLEGDINVYGGDITTNCIGKYFVDFFWPMPKISELTLELSVDYCRKNNIKAIIPSRDGELEYWASKKEELRKIGISVMVSDLPSIEICLDKLLFSQKLMAANLPVIPSFLSVKNMPSGNVVVKERYGAGSINNALNISKEKALFYSKKLDFPIFQPYIKGKEFSIDVYIDRKGLAKGAIVRSRDLIINGESQITSTISNTKLESLGCAVAEILQLYGHVLIQIIEDDRGNFHIVECNSRFGGASTLSIAAGLDTFYWFLLEASNKDISTCEFKKSPTDKTQIRYPEDIILNGPSI